MDTITPSMGARLVHLELQIVPSALEERAILTVKDIEGEIIECSFHYFITSFYEQKI